MIEVSKALKIIKRETRPLGAERVALEHAVGRVLAEEIVTDSDMPPFDRSQMDGYALKAADTMAAPVTLKIVGESAAGRGWHKVLKTGEAVRIMTGAPIPAGADAVQKIELTMESNGVVSITEPTSVGKYIVYKGQEVKKGSKVLRAGDVISANNISIPAAFGYSRVMVAKRPRVAIISTGSEIVDIGRKPKRDQIRNSNSIMLKTLCEQAGAVARVFPIIGDDLCELKSQIKVAAKESNILITTGGVSVGKYDLTKLALTELGADVFFERVRLKPGKPTVFAKLKNTLVFGLPGNPVSAAATFYLFVRKAILIMQGAAHSDLNNGTAIVSKPVRAPKERDAYLPAVLISETDGTLKADPLEWHGSSDFIGFADSDALISIPRGSAFDAGSPVPVLFL